jgi:hypothetical protein
LGLHSRFAGGHAHEVKRAKKDPEGEKSFRVLGGITLRITRLRVGKVRLNKMWLCQQTNFEK